MAVVPIEHVANLESGNWDSVIIVSEEINWESTSGLDVFKPVVQSSADVDKCVEKEVSVHPFKHGSIKLLVFSPTGPVNRDFDDVRRYGEAAHAGVVRAIKAGYRRPVLALPNGAFFENSSLVALLGALHAAYVPLEVREGVPARAAKLDGLGFYSSDAAQGTALITKATALEAGRTVARDIGGSDPERMAAQRVAEYLQETFYGSSVKVSVESDEKMFRTKYPLLHAVNRCAEMIERHQGRVVNLEYVGEGDIKDTYLFVGKGITYDTGGADVKAGGVMAGMHRDKCGAATVAGFFKVLAALKPKGIKVLGKLAMVRNSIGADSYVADEIITSAEGVRIRVGNTDAEGRMVMSDPLHHMKEQAKKEINPHIMTIATLTGHAIRAYGEHYSIVLDNGPAAKKRFAQNIQEAGHSLADPFEISTVRREDYQMVAGPSEYEDVIQCNNKPSSATARGHQFPAAFMMRASGLDKHGIDSSQPICYSHFDIAGSSGPFPGLPTGAPIVALARVTGIV